MTTAPAPIVRYAGTRKTALALLLSYAPGFTFSTTSNGINEMITRAEMAGLKVRWKYNNVLSVLKDGTMIGRWYKNQKQAEIFAA